MVHTILHRYIFYSVEDIPLKFKAINVIFPIVMVFLMWVCCNYVITIGEAIKHSIDVCLTSIVPSMYAFMILSELLVRSNSHRIIGNILSPISRNVLHLDGKLFPILLISLVAGYPVGAKLISTLEDNGSIDTNVAKDMYCYCYSGGLAFIIGTIGGSLKVSLIVYISNVVANLTLAFMLNFKHIVPNKDVCKADVKISSNVLVDSINSSFKTMINVCIMIISFSIAICLLDVFNISDILSMAISKVLHMSKTSSQSILNATLEVSQTANVSMVGSLYLPTIAMIFSFGGVCVIMQILSIAGKSFNLKHFLKCRIFTSAVSFLICTILTRLLLADTLTTSYICNAKVTQEDSIVPSICLICMSFILLSKNTRHSSHNVL